MRSRVGVKEGENGVGEGVEVDGVGVHFLFLGFVEHGVFWKERVISHWAKKRRMELGVGGMWILTHLNIEPDILR